MKDERLTNENLIFALAELGVTPDTIHRVFLYFNQLLTIHACDVCFRLGIAAHQQHIDYAEYSDARWGVEFDGRRLEFDGVYDTADALRVYRKADDCGNLCAYIEPYGWVAEAGCLIHDGED